MLGCVGVFVPGLPSSGDQHYTTHQTKTWCPPATGCQEWSGGGVSCALGERCDAASLAAQVKTTTMAMLPMFSRPVSFLLAVSFLLQKTVTVLVPKAFF